MRSLGWVLFQYEWYPYKKRSGHIYRGKTMWRYKEKMTIYKLKGEVSEVNPASILIWVLVLLLALTGFILAFSHGLHFFFVVESQTWCIEWWDLGQITFNMRFYVNIHWICNCQRLQFLLVFLFLSLLLSLEFSKNSLNRALTLQLFQL